MKNYDLEEIKKKDWITLYYEVKHEEGTYLLIEAECCVVDDYGYDGSVELSHHESLGYNTLKNFNLPDSTTTLDLTWLGKDDNFDLYNIKQQEYIKELKTNINNLRLSYYESKTADPILLTVCYGNKKIGFFKKVKYYKEFIEKNKDIIGSVQLENFPSLMEKILINYTEKQDIQISKEDKPKIKVK